MKYIQSGYKGTAKELNVYFLGDLHYGSREFREEYLLRRLREIDRNRHNSRIVIMGDLLEVALRDSVGAGVYEQNKTVQEQIDWAVKTFRPYRDLIDVAVSGNHEQRVYQRTGLDIMKTICQALGIEDRYSPYQAIVKFSWNQVAYNIHVFHGSGGGTSTSSVVNQLEKMTRIVEGVDVHVIGHFHQLLAYPKKIHYLDMRNMTIQEMTKWFICTGSSLDYQESYAEMKGLAPTALGFPRVTLRGVKGHKHIKVDLGA